MLGKGGTGKSFNLDAVVTSLKEELSYTSANYSKHGTTGIAASNINGTTIHSWKSGLGFFGEKISPLKGNTLLELQQVWRQRKLIIIDEFSMLRQKELHFINERLKQIMCSNDLFGGLVVVLVGDPGQLPPVKGKCLWDKKPRNQSPDWFGSILYNKFTTAIKLIQSNRLDKSDPESIFFEKFLDRLRNGTNTREDWVYFRDRGSRDTIGQCEWKERGFDNIDTVHLYTTNKEVAQRNLHCLQCGNCKNSCKQHRRWKKIYIF